MTRAQRIVLILYLFLLAYCCLWLPWRVPIGHDRYERAGYGWLWAGPHQPAPIVYDRPVDAGNGYQIVGEEDPLFPPTVVPDFPVMGLRFMAATLLWAAAFLITRTWKASALGG